MDIASRYADGAMRLFQQYYADPKALETKLMFLFQDALATALVESENEALLDMQIALTFYSEPVNYHQGLEVDQYGGLAREVLKKWAAKQI